MVTIFTTGEKVSSKSIPSLWLNPLATSLALYLSTSPLDLYLTLKIHLQPIGFLPLGRSTIDQVLFL
ncbi:hypothetical protein HanIR_Chr06g0297071 [Helianthus annuus]|nr:hypothetical protein HanIR_Chr06g0297071 [Helianthus annuus]